jgi:thymidylate synthase (FAD)
VNVKLVSITEPLDTQLASAEDLVAYCARVSNPSNQLNSETAPKLLSFLIKHKHWSPFEMVDMCVEITTSRAIAAQILRHRSFSFQEFSQRYSVATEFEPIELRLQGEKNRQVGEKLLDLQSQEGRFAAFSVDCMLKKCKETYDDLIKSGIAKEVARLVLPLTTSTTIYMKGSLRSWIHFIELRTEQNTQKEHRQIAQAIKSIFVQQFPVISDALGWNKTVDNTHS